MRMTRADALGVLLQGEAKRVFVTHGDDQVCDLFAERLKNELGYDAMAPFSGTEFDMLANELRRKRLELSSNTRRRRQKPARLPVFMQDFLQQDSG